VYLPRVEEAASSAEPKSDRAPAPRGAETVLLVEDEDAVRSLVRIILQGAGYRVLEASDAVPSLSCAI
jgi:PleD family two-component response regulator